jgi:hypothetical protein
MERYIDLEDWEMNRKKSFNIQCCKPEPFTVLLLSRVHVHTSWAQVCFLAFTSGRPASRFALPYSGSI